MPPQDAEHHSRVAGEADLIERMKADVRALLIDTTALQQKAIKEILQQLHKRVEASPQAQKTFAIIRELLGMPFNRQPEMRPGEPPPS